MSGIYHWVSGWIFLDFFSFFFEGKHSAKRCEVIFVEKYYEMISFHCTDHELQIIKLCIGDDIKISDEMEKGNEDGRG